MLERTLRRAQRRTRRRARRDFDPVVLESVCNASILGFDDYGTVTSTGKDADEFHIYRDNGSKVLGVAHLDSVVGKRFCRVLSGGGDALIQSPSLDDRLGVYVICHLLPRLGINIDWLLTTGEETGNSSARHFDTDKQYNWMFSFDRMGTDAVAYDYESPELRFLLRQTGVNVGLGSFSDICYLEHLGCIGVNWGVGYRDYHSPRAHAWLSDIALQVGRFVQFYRQHADTHMPYDWRTPRPKWWEVIESDREEFDTCPVCASMFFRDGKCEECDYDEWDADPGPFRFHRRASVHDMTDGEWTRADAALDNVFKAMAARGQIKGEVTA